MTIAPMPAMETAATSECSRHDTLPGPHRPGSPGGVA